jgi:3-phenylpropionate/trans-cinnamate dioxygenase ferredoxin reductase subunit
MLGATEPIGDVHWFWSDQYDHNLQMVGYALSWDGIEVRGSLGDRDFVAFYVKDGIVEAVAGLDRGREVRRARDLVRAHRRVDPAQLRDPDVDLKTLAAG